MLDLHTQGQQALQAARRMITVSTDQKNEALEAIAQGLLDHTDAILEANAEDVERTRSTGETVMIDRLLLTKERIEAMAADVHTVIQLDDEVGKIMDERVRPNGLRIQRVRCPLGVVGMIYESRPNVTVDATVLCLKSGNAVMLKGGSDAIASNRVLVEIMRNALKSTAIPQDAIQFLDTTDRAVTADFLRLKGVLDVVIPRGGRGLIEFVVQNSTVPVIETGASVVHTYVDRAADLEKATAIVMNAKTRRVSICGALDTLLVHADCAESFLRTAVSQFEAKGVELRCDSRSFCILRCTRCGHSPEEACTLDPHASKSIVLAKPEDFGCEFLDTILAIKVVDSLEDALDHIARYSLKHSEAVVTEDAAVAERFLKEVDAAVVYWNTSTQFSDGAQFGLGAEIGISTQKLHIRGPFALEGLTSFKWVVRGDGQVR